MSSYLMSLSPYVLYSRYSKVNLKYDTRVPNVSRGALISTKLKMVSIKACETAVASEPQSIRSILLYIYNRNQKTQEKIDIA